MAVREEKMSEVVAAARAQLARARPVVWVEAVADVRAAVD
eukprot:gene8963-35189_t